MKFFKTLAVAAIAFFVALVMAGPASAASPHFVKGPTGTVSGNSLIVTFKAAGLGNAEETAEFTLSGSVTTTSQCYTKSGNPVNGVPKTETATINDTEEFPVRNGSVTGSFTLSPLSTLTCTGNQRVVITDVSFTNLTVSGEGISAPVTLN
jgi:hypothetical protein